MKKCTKCNLLKDESEFYQKKYRKTSELRADCKDCFKKRASAYGEQHKKEVGDYKRQYYIENHSLISSKRKALKKEKKEIIEAKKNNSCLDCGGWFASCAMDFDHRKPEEKRDSISRLSNTLYSVDVLLEELKKCDLVCACCHRDRTHSRLQMHKPKRKYPNKEVKYKFINEKKNKSCVDCGKLFNPWQMDFDHLGQKSFKISNAVVLSCTTVQILEEIEKCEVVCVNCHRVRTQRRKNESG